MKIKLNLNDSQGITYDKLVSCQVSNRSGDIAYERFAGISPQGNINYDLTPYKVKGITPKEFQTSQEVFQGLLKIINKN